MRDWSVDDTFKLIGELEEKRCLWERTNPDYKKTNKRMEGLAEIAETFENCTPHDVKIKIRSLRCIFMEKLRDIKKRGRTSGGDHVKWQFFSALEFLKGEAYEFRANDAAVIKDNEMVEPNEKQLQHCHIPIESRSPNSSSEYKEKRKRDDDASMEMAFEQHKMMHEFAVNFKEKEENKYLDFGNFVATTIENLKDPDLEELCQLKVRLILSEISAEACKRQIMNFKCRTTSTNSAHSFTDTKAQFGHYFE